MMACDYQVSHLTEGVCTEHGHDLAYIAMAMMQHSMVACLFGVLKAFHANNGSVNAWFYT